MDIFYNFLTYRELLFGAKKQRKNKTPPYQQTQRTVYGKDRYILTKSGKPRFAIRVEPWGCYTPHPVWG